jgi:hypothetical protein
MSRELSFLDDAEKVARYGSQIGVPTPELNETIILAQQAPTTNNLSDAEVDQKLLAAQARALRDLNVSGIKAIRA